MINKNVLTRHKYFASLYDMFVKIVFLGFDKKLRVEGVKLAGINPGDRIIDVGCGTGTLILSIAESFNGKCKLVGIDIANNMLNIARKKARQKKLEVDFENQCVELLSYPDSYFDIAVASMLFHHLDKKQKYKALLEILRILKPGGKLLIIDIGKPTKQVIKFLFLPSNISIIIKFFISFLLKRANFLDNIKGNLPCIIEKYGFTVLAHNKELGAIDLILSEWRMTNK